jgi:aromatic ring-opening dioxygenase LigB subunit
MSAEPSRRAGGVFFAALMPHAPILIPDVGREAPKPAAASVDALKNVAARLANRPLDAVVVISPHSPRRLGTFGVWSGSRLCGNFAQFGAPQAAVDLPNDTAFAAELKLQAGQVGLQTWEIPVQTLDYGALVPLWYLVNAGWGRPAAVLSLRRPGERGSGQLGRAIMGAAAKVGERIAVIASGDMSHRLTPNAPAGYDPRARDFDRRFIACLRRGAYHDLERFDPELQDLAGEDVLDSTIVALAAVSWETTGHEVLSYEGPFGVGYGVAVLFDSTIPATCLENGSSAASRCRKAS